MKYILKSSCKNAQIVLSKHVTQQKTQLLDTELPVQYAPLHTVVSCLGWTYLQGQQQSV